MGLYDDIKKIVSEDKVLINEPMSKHTTFRIGGNADFFVVPTTMEELIELLKLDAPKTVIGNGSNLLVKDSGIRGIVIRTSGLNKYHVDEDMITASAGVMIPKLSIFARDNSLSGLEFACRNSWYCWWMCYDECRCIW